MFYNDILFPIDISFNSPGRPIFVNNIVRIPSGHRQVDIKRDTPLWGWDVGYGARRAKKIYDLYQLYLVVRGSGHLFLFKNWHDFKSCHGDQKTTAVTPLDQLIATATAGQTQFQLIKTYTVASASLVRTIYKPKAGTLRVSVDGAEEVSGWTMNAATGIITRSSGLAVGKIVRAGYEYYLPACFSNEEIDMNFIAWTTGDAKVQLEESRDFE